ncbi:T9SS type B sorting domain-containing protein [Aquimarina sp. 2201CG1-2-11]|uniref:T9SS type B sorting domain-containing protein n=1 Tax=Aquimarina discodermiae TaxID=3231043 RepID=UPI003462081B
MKTKMLMKMVLVLLFVTSNISTIYAQEIVPLGPRETRNRIKGNLVMNGNAIVGLVDSDDDNVTYDPNAPYNGNFSNGNSISDYIDIDGDPTTFSSSSANFNFDLDENGIYDSGRETLGCMSVVYAGLYWSATYYIERIPTVSPSFTVNNTALAGDYTILNNTFSPGSVPLPPTPGITANLVLVDDNNPVDEDGCTALVNGAQVNGNIAVIRRGSCTFTSKVINAQNAGAIAVIIVNNVAGEITLGGGDAGVSIPAVSINQTDGDAIITQMASSTVNATLSAVTTANPTGDELLTGLPLADARKVGAADFRQIKFRVPGGAYVDVTPDNIIYDGYRNTPTNPSDSATDDVPYVCYADVTSLIDQDMLSGNYFVANMNATIGRTSGSSGASGGWVLVMIYEDPLETSKYISTNDGFVEIQNSSADVDFTYTGFTTLPAPLPVEARYGVAALEGDRGLGATTFRPNGDQLLIENTAVPSAFVPFGQDISVPADNFDPNPTINFFNSSITFNHDYIDTRNPNSENTLGLDIDFFDLPNTGNVLVGNDQTDATFRLATDADTYRVFLNTFVVEIIEPELNIIKRVFDTDGVTDITDQNVELGDEMFYNLEIQNVGNEDLLDAATDPFGLGTVITDNLPDNVNLVSVQDATLPPGVTYTVNPPSQIIFQIPPELVEENDPPINIRFRVALVNSCEELRDACSSTIQNSAIARFTGAISREEGTNNSSAVIGPCGNTDGEATNFLVNVPACSSNVTFCTNDLILTAGLGYDVYTWSGPGITGTLVENDNVLIFDQVGITPQSGTYTVIKEDSSGTCMTLTEEFVVEGFRDIVNPVLAYVNGTTVVSTNCSGLELPQILLCGDQTFDLNTNFDPASLVSISWQLLSPSGSCISDSNDPCSLLSGNCTATNWIEEPGGNGSSFTVDTAGDYRIFAEFTGGCTIPFYFSVFKNDYQPTLSATDIECGNDGSVTVTNAPAGFEFSLTQGGPYSATTVFPIPSGSGGDVTVYGIDTNFTGCEYTATINVIERITSIAVTNTDPTCVNDDNGNGTGSISIVVTDGSPVYSYIISSTTLVPPVNINVPNSNTANFTQDNLLPDTYNVQVLANVPNSGTTNCVANPSITINPAPPFEANVSLVSPATCVSGPIVRVNVTAGSGNYLYDDGSGTFQANNEFEITNPDPATTYTFFVSDNSLAGSGTPACIISADITGLEAYEPIVLDNVTVTQPPCPGDGGLVEVTVSPVVAGRTYTYQLLDTTDQDPVAPVYTVVEQIVTTATTVTFTNIADLTHYRIRVFHNDTAIPPGAPICPVDGVDFAINTPGAITANISVPKELTCSAPTDATIRVENIAGGSGTYEWSFNATTGYTPVVGTSVDISVSTSGGFTVYIRNQGTNDCAIPFSTNVATLVTIDDIIFSTADANCANQTITVTPAAQPVGPVYTYAVAPAPVSGDAVAGYVLNRGTTYTFTATNPTNGCTYNEDFSLPVLPEIEITSAIETKPINCFGGNDGAFTFTVTNSASFDYEIVDGGGIVIANDTGVTSPVIIQSPTTPLVAGTYTINVTDTALPAGSNCTDTETVTISQPAAALDLTAVIDAADCGVNTGVITVTATGGRGGYEYELRDAAGVAILVPYQTSNTFSGQAPGTYTVFIRDSASNLAISCEYDEQVVVPGTTAPTIALDASGDPCYDPTDPTTATQRITITLGVPAPVGPFTYSLDGGAAQTVDFTTPVGMPANTFQINGLTPGAHNVTVTNTASLCSSNTVNFTINEELIVTASLTKEIDCVDGATITFSATGGDGTYTFNLLGPAPQAGVVSPLTNILTDGTYQIQVTDGLGCTVTSPDIIVNPYDALVATATPIEPACSSDTGGITVTIDPANLGEPNYTYILDQGTANEVTFGPTANTSHTFNGVDALVAHNVLVQDQFGCDFNLGPINLTPPTDIAVTTNITRVLNCTPTPEAQVEVTTITGGSGVYEYSLDNVTFTAAPATPFTIVPDFATAGNYVLYVRNQTTDDCVQQFPIVIAPRLEITDITFAESNDDCTNQQITVIPSAVGDAPIPAYTYAVAPAPVSGDAILGFVLNRNVNYTFTATRGDNSCTFSRDYRADLLDEIQITNAAQTQPVTCIGGNDGAFSFTVTNAATFDYEIIEDAGGTVIDTGTGVTSPVTIQSPGTPLIAGDYTINVTDTAFAPNSCTATASVTITEPTTPITFNHTVDQTCNDNTVSINTVAGGNGPVYEYELFDSTDVSQGPAIPITGTYTGVPNGTGYYIIVRDSQGCPERGLPFDITALPAVTLSLTGSELCLDDNSATLDIDVTGGTADFSYEVTRDGISVIGNTPLGAGITTIPTITVTQAGTYVVTVTDSAGCTEQITQVIAPQVAITASLLKDLDCSVSPDAQIDVVVTPGTGNGATTLQININGGGFVNYTGPVPFTTNTAGTYQFRVIDAATCSADSAIITVTPAPNPVVNPPTITNPTCNGDTDGAVVINIDTSVGTGPYEVDFDGAGFSNQTTYGGLGDGTYNYTVRDSKGCTVTDTAVLSAPPVIIDNINFDDIQCDASGTITLGEIRFNGITGGVPPYTATLFNTADFSVATTTSTNPIVVPFATGSNITFSDLSFGDYTLRVVDSNGCAFDFTRSISTTPIFTISATSTATCSAGVTATINVTGGAPPYQIREYTPAGTEPFIALNPGPNIHIFNNLPFDTPFIFEVRDNNGCTDIQTLTPPLNPSTIDIDLTENPVRCFGDADGSIEYEITNYQGTELTYSIFRSNDLVNPITGTVTFSAGNVQTVPAAGTAIGTVSDFGPGTYVIRVEETDALVADPCNASMEFTITESATPLMYNGTTITDGNCNASSQGIVSVSGGTGPYGFLVVPQGDPNPGTYNASNVVTLDQTIAINWDLYITDANNCVLGPELLMATVTADPTFTGVPVAFVDDPCNYDNNYTFTVTATGTGDLEYGIDDGDTGTADVPTFVADIPSDGTFTFTVFGPGVYNYFVRDANGCTDTRTITVYDPLSISAVFTTPPTCTAADGVITATVTGTAAGILAFELQDGSGAATGNISGDGTGVYTGVAPGNYIVQVTDPGRGPAGCSFTTPVSIQAPPLPTIDGTVGVTNMTCNSDAPPTGSITVSLTGALDPAVTYEYEIAVAPAVPGGGPRQTSNVFNNLDADTYNVRVWATLTNGSGASAQDVVCFDDESFTITEPAVVDGVVAQGDHFDCDGASTNATIEITGVIGGNVSGAYTADITRVSDGTVFADIAITPPTTSFEVSEPGAYTVQIFDSNDCQSAILNVNIAAYTPMSNPVVTQINPKSCLTPPPVNAGDEEITVTVTGGSGNFRFDVFDTTNTLIDSDTTAGSNTSGSLFLPNLELYTIVVTDLGDANQMGLNCEITTTYQVPDFDFLDVSAVAVTNLSCNAEPTGEIELTVNGYTGDFEYDVIDTATNLPIRTAVPVTAPFVNPITISTLPAGTFRIEVRETALPNCSGTTNDVTISEPDLLTLVLDSATTPHCNALLSTVTMTAGGGVGPYNFAFVPGTLTLLPVQIPADPAMYPESATFDLNPGLSLDWVIFVQDANGCVTPVQIAIPDVTPAPTIDMIDTFVDDSCTFDSLYEFTVTGTTNVVPGTGGLTFELTHPSGVVDAPVPGNQTTTSHQFVVTTPGIYSVRVFDENGCPSTPETITVYPELLVTATFTDPTCRAADGTIIGTVSGGSAIPANWTFDLIDVGTGVTLVGVTIAPGVPTANDVTFGNVPPGDYIVSVNDSAIGPNPPAPGGCTATFNITVPTFLDPTATTTVEDVSCNGGGDGTILVTMIAPGNVDTPYSYQITAPVAGLVQTDPLFTGLSQGTYDIEITSDKGCSITIQETVGEPADITVSATQTAYGCNPADSDEIFPVITVTIDGGTPPYNITYVGPSSTGTDTNITDADGNPANGVQYVFTAPVSGAYSITVTDSESCSPNTAAMDPLVVPVPAFDIMTNPAVAVNTAISCPAGEDVTVSVTGGTGTYDYTVITSPNPVAPQPGVVGAANFILPDVGFYTFRITDTTTMCFIDVNHTIDPFDNAVVTATSPTPETCFGNADGTIAISVTNYIGDISYVIFDVGVTPEAIVHTSVVNVPIPNDLPILLPETLPVGNYRIDIVEIDAPFCSKSSNTFTVDGPSIPFEVELLPINDQEFCDPASNISFLTSISGARSTNITYTLDQTGTFNTTGLFTNLAFAQAVDVSALSGNAGDFGFTVTVEDDVNGDLSVVCVATNHIVVTPPADDVNANAVATDITCFEATDGTITVTATGTDAPLRYSITQTAPVPGTESVLQTVNTFENLGPGTYTIMVYDQLGCTDQVTGLVVGDVPEVTVSAVITRPVSCGNDTVDVTVTGTTSAAGGITRFVMVNVTDPNNPVETSQATGLFTTIPEGQYVFYVEDSPNGCRSQDSSPVAVLPIEPVSFDIDPVATTDEVNCNGDTTGIINIMNLLGGIGAYEFYLLSGTVALPVGAVPPGIVAGPQATTEFAGLAPGTYTYLARSVTDISCAAVRTHTIQEPPVFDPQFVGTDITCAGEDDGMITITIDATDPNVIGTPPYSFAISSMPGVFFNDASDETPNSHIFEDLGPGMYTVLAQDANGCDVTFDYTVDEPNSLMASIDGAVTPETCFGDSDGAVTIIISGGTPPYETNITNNDADFVANLLTYTGLPGGTTIIYIRDANGCRIDIEIPVPAGPNLGAILTDRVECPIFDYTDPFNPVMTQEERYFVDFDIITESEGLSIIYTLNGINGTPNPANNTNTTGIFEVAPGEYEGFMESGTCSSPGRTVGTITVLEYTPLAIPVAQMTNNPEDPNEYEIIVSGGRQFDNEPNYVYSFTLLPEGLTIDRLDDSFFTELSGNIFTIRETGDYVIRVVDAAGCEVMIVQSLTYINIRIPNYFTPDNPNSTTEQQFWYPQQIDDPTIDDPFYFENMEVMVFDRYGRLLAEFKGNQQGWDGTYKGKQLPSGDYWYTIILNDVDNREFTGHFTLYR